MRLFSKLFCVYVQEPTWLINSVAITSNIIHICALNTGIATVPFVALERLWATVKSNGYEYRGMKIACSLLAIEVRSQHNHLFFYLINLVVSGICRLSNC